MCGDDPRSPAIESKPPWCSPHVRGWSLSDVFGGFKHKVFPACAGMIPAQGNAEKARLRVPRMCGDDPLSSKRMREGLGHSVPRMCGDDPVTTPKKITFDECSPHVRG